jgi:NAD(P)H-dependent FMN reductase
MRLLAISGSLRRSSSNTAVLHAAAQLAPDGMHIDLYPSVGELPHFNPDLDGDRPPPAVLELRRLIGACDGLLISSPEYARGVAGSLKNALDWLVSSSEFPDKPTALINASPRATHADAHLRVTLTTMSARLIEVACLALPLLGRNLDADAIAADDSLASPLRAALEAFARAIRQSR